MYVCMYVCMYVYTRTHTHSLTLSLSHTHTHSLSLSLSLTQVTSGVRCDVLLNVMTTFIDETKDERKVRAQMAVLVAYQVCP